MEFFLLIILIHSYLYLIFQVYEIIDNILVLILEFFMLIEKQVIFLLFFYFLVIIIKFYFMFQSINVLRQVLKLN